VGPKMLRGRAGGKGRAWELELASGGPFGLGELLEDRPEHLRRDPDPRVPGSIQPNRSSPYLLVVHLDRATARRPSPVRSNSSARIGVSACPDPAKLGLVRWHP
jgi:hypothetical protein